MGLQFCCAQCPCFQLSKIRPQPHKGREKERKKKEKEKKKGTPTPPETSSCGNWNCPLQGQTGATQTANYFLTLLRFARNSTTTTFLSAVKSSVCASISNTLDLVFVVAVVSSEEV